DDASIAAAGIDVHLRPARPWQEAPCRRARILTPSVVDVPGAVVGHVGPLNAARAAETLRQSGTGGDRRDLVPSDGEDVREVTGGLGGRRRGGSGCGGGLRLTHLPRPPRLRRPRRRSTEPSTRKAQEAVHPITEEGCAYQPPRGASPL